MVKCTNNLAFRQFVEVLSKMPTIDARWYEKREKARTYFEQHKTTDSQEEVRMKLHYLNSAAKTRIYKSSEVVEKILKIKDFSSRVQKGDENLIEETVKAFAPDTNNVTWAQFQNALHFLALHQPEKYVEIDNESRPLLLNLISDTADFSGTLIPIGSILNIYRLIKSVYDSIREISKLPDASYDNIFDKLHDWGFVLLIILTDEKVLNVVGSISFDVAMEILQAHGIIIPPVIRYSLQNIWDALISATIDLFAVNLNSTHNKLLQQLNKFRNTNSNK